MKKKKSHLLRMGEAAATGFSSFATATSSAAALGAGRVLPPNDGREKRSKQAKNKNIKIIMLWLVPS